MKRSALMEECRNEGRRDVVFEVLEGRFGPVPKDIRKRLATIRERSPLLSLIRLAVRCDSLDQFRQDMVSVNGNDA